MASLFNLVDLFNNRDDVHVITTEEKVITYIYIKFKEGYPIPELITGKEISPYYLHNTFNKNEEDFYTFIYLNESLN